ncbi:uncharacterized protein K452DRAFT_330241 [Aplosporella prunicola CBS 121167]|uniref:Uncharacterized protein n=1 Tax=Aplosporella prunicola CBS 121167 TaxID=1176127 RepID=A0A6A6AVV1_9PEZI|nr:uncharacterized protein K452DRAFT_330241 [Aplosporella prunicola CBS 121167]KAF2135358.1 hypothetical protein K452DRAFT_330241 [Aplosporella prunicola CBS 121167]
MSAKDSSLYGVPRPKRASGKEISSSTTLAFTSQLSSLIAGAGSSTSTTSGRARASTGKKDDIFSTHNKGARKRALKDLDDADFTQKHSTTSDAIDDATWRRAKRKMSEKARLYAAMKRGDVEDGDERYAVDFDRKWAEKEAGGGGTTSDDSDDDDDDDDDDPAAKEAVEYVDEFGRTRTGTRADAARAQRRQHAQADEPDRFTARPAAPANLIYGDTVQSAAFNPDEAVAQRMAEMAARRDKTPSPPPDAHFDGRAEIRTKGVGFFHFSKDEEERKQQMEELKRERKETEEKRGERERKREERKREVEERRKAIAQKRSKAKADKFLDGLMGELEGKAGSAKQSQTTPPHSTLAVASSAIRPAPPIARPGTLRTTQQSKATSKRAS